MYIFKCVLVYKIHFIVILTKSWRQNDYICIFSLYKTNCLYGKTISTVPKNNRPLISGIALKSLRNSANVLLCRKKFSCGFYYLSFFNCIIFFSFLSSHFLIVFIKSCSPLTVVPTVPLGGAVVSHVCLLQLLSQIINADAQSECFLRLNLQCFSVRWDEWGFQRRILTFVAAVGIIDVIWCSLWHFSIIIVFGRLSFHL